MADEELHTIDPNEPQDLQPEHDAETVESVEAETVESVETVEAVETIETVETVEKSDEAEEVAEAAGTEETAETQETEEAEGAEASAEEDVSEEDAASEEDVTPEDEAEAEGETDEESDEEEEEEEEDDEISFVNMDKVEAVLNASADRAVLTPQMRRMMSRQEETTRRVEESIKGTKSNPRWFVPLFCILMVIGLIWVVAYYLTSTYPIPNIGNWNLLIGFVIIMIGFLMTMWWR